MTGYLRRTGQFVVILLLFSAVSAFANWPIYRQIPEGSAVVVLTFVHGADRKAECRTRSDRKTGPQHAARSGLPARPPPDLRRTRPCRQEHLPSLFAADWNRGRRTFPRLPALRGTGRTVRDRRADARHAAHRRLRPRAQGNCHARARANVRCRFSFRER